MSKIPRGLYSTAHNGLCDPEAYTVKERAQNSTERVSAEHDRRRSPSPMIRRLQAATDKALGRSAR